MAIDLKFVKSDNATPWGFRLVGGSDFDQPIVVVKVNENSLAEEAGLEVGDIIVRINDVPTAGLTHNEAHDLLTSAGLEFILGVRKGELLRNIICDEDYNIEDYSSTLRDVIEKEVIDQAVKVVDSVKDSRKEESSVTLGENLLGQEKIITTTTSASQSSEETTKEKKWSTFLVKPAKPIPKPKKKVEERTITGEPYRVVIKKQPRRRSFQEKKVQFDNNVTEVEVDIESESREEISEIEMSKKRELQSIEVEVKVTETEELLVEEEEIDELNCHTEEEVALETEQCLETNEYEAQATNLLQNIQIQQSTKTSISLEEQLIAVQKQLQALSQLPSAIQLTIDAVSQQLASIVGARKSSEDNSIDKEDSVIKEDEIPEEVENDIPEEASISEEAQAEMNGIASEGSISSIDEELEEDVAKEIKQEEDEEVEETKEQKEPDPYEGLTEEEKEEKIREEQMLAKKQKIKMENAERTPRPIQRPIILPGGRRWSNPEDAIPNFRKPKMSDEKIVETIENNLEVIIGKRKGINFLKYQPPPKSMDYLQRSEVYRLVHDMEPPVRGITTRAELVPAVQDYYEATKGAP